MVSTIVYKPQNELSKGLLTGRFSAGDHVVIDHDPEAEGNYKLRFEARKADAVELFAAAAGAEQPV